MPNLLYNRYKESGVIYMGKRIFIAHLLMPILILSLIMPIRAEAAVNLSANDALLSVYTMSPYSVRSTFEQTGWDLRVTDGGVLNTLFGAESGDVAGVTVYDEMAIYLSDYGNYSFMSINHEMGHYFDYVNGLLDGKLPSRTDDFLYVFKEEGYADQFFEDYMVTNSSEYFAQAYKYVCENPEALSTRPLTYSYFLSLIHKFDQRYNEGFYIVEDPTIWERDITAASFGLPEVVEVNKNPVPGELPVLMTEKKHGFIDGYDSSVRIYTRPSTTTY